MNSEPLYFIFDRQNQILLEIVTQEKNVFRWQSRVNLVINIWFLDATLIWSSCHNLILPTHRVIATEISCSVSNWVVIFPSWLDTYRYFTEQFTICQSLSKWHLQIAGGVNSFVQNINSHSFHLFFQVPGGLTVCVRWTWWVSSRNTWPSSPVGGTGGAGPSSHSPPPLEGKGPSQRTTGHSCNTCWGCHGKTSIYSWSCKYKSK